MNTKFAHVNRLAISENIRLPAQCFARTLSITLRLRAQSARLRGLTYTAVPRFARTFSCQGGAAAPPPPSALASWHVINKRHETTTHAGHVCSDRSYAKYVRSHNAFFNAATLIAHWATNYIYACCSNVQTHSYTPIILFFTACSSAQGSIKNDFSSKGKTLIFYCSWEWWDPNPVTNQHQT